MPVGVITSSTTIAATADPAPDEARWFAVGVTDRGPVDRAVRCRSFKQFEDTFGAAVNYSDFHAQVKAYYAEGGYEVWAARVVGAAAVKATRSMDTGKIVVTAIDPGSFANAWTVAWTVATHTLTLVTDDGTETYVGTTSAELLAAVNGVSTKITVSSSGTLPSSNVAAAALASGVDDHAAIDTTALTTALTLFDASLGVGAVSIPGWTVDDLGAALITHGTANDRIVLQGTDRADTVTDAAGFVATLAGDDDDGVLGVLWPWVTIPTTAVISPEGAIAGHRCATIRQFGAWVAPAGGNGALKYVTGVDQTVTDAELQTAHDAGVNVVIPVAGVPTLYGWRSASADVGNYRYLSARDTVNLVKSLFKSGLARYVYAPLSTALVQQVLGTSEGILKDLAARGAFYPYTDPTTDASDPGWAVTVGDAVVDGAGFIDVDASIRPTPGAEALRVGTTKIPLNTAL